jgi:hypothetical protein
MTAAGSAYGGGPRVPLCLEPPSVEKLTSSGAGGMGDGGESPWPSIW